MFIFDLRKPEPKQTATSRFLGVNWDKQYQKWKVSIRANDRKKILGYFDDELEAARCYNDAAKKLGRDTLNVLPMTA